MMKVMKSILVTGSNGLLGQALLKRLQVQKEVSLIASSLHESRIPVSGFNFERMDALLCL